MRALRWAFCIVLPCLAATTGASAQQRMTDQLFGISYDPKKVHFERMPPVLAEKCPRLQDRYVAAWVYGHLKTADSEYFLISGLMEFQEDKPGGAHTIAPEEGDGLIVALRGSQCLVDQASYFFDQSINPAKTATPIMVPKSVLTGILQESFKRYVIAFGGKQEFLKRVKPSAALPFVREQIEIFEREP
ncbi:MAG TPA: hypothetical protein VJW94_02570 [Candidatus Acidoferrum sp.]|nr:hypothetical protein [Candidatus Acidoferrum sp.]